VDRLESQIKGWEKRGIYDDPQLTRLLEIYKELGFIARLEPFRSAMQEGCNECMKENPERYKVLYTKRNDVE